MKFVLCAMLISSLFCCAFAQTTPASQSQKLKALQKELAAKQRKLQNTQASAIELKAVLKRSELAIAAIAKALNNTKNELQHNEAEQVSLREEAQTLRTLIQQQQAHLAAQIRSAYLAGNYDYAKMLFNQEDGLRFERVLTYYQYFNSARQQAITAFRENVEELERVNQRLETSAVQLTKLLAEQRDQTAELSTRQQDRELTLTKLTKVISSQRIEVATLEQNEEALKRAIDEAEKARKEARASDLTLTGLADYRGTLLIPAKGKLQPLYGKRRQGQVRWKGIVIEGSEGGEVKAIHQGRVLYADWLKGFGLVIIVDHGKGYMSVYGHNQALLKQAGAVVKAGEKLALIGQSGGQAYPNLYFEVRHKGKALDPLQWVNF